LNVIVAFHTLGIAHQSANVLLFAPQVTKCQLVGVDGKVRESCFLYTCASVAIVVQLFHAAVVLLGTTGLVQNVLVQLIV
jgi:hypothetical protein